MWTRLRSLAAGLLRRSRFETDMDEELRFHQERQIDDLVASGLTREEASRRTRLAFGHVDTVKDGCRRARAMSLVDDVVRDLRHAVRLLRRSPGFAATVVATLALCIGANTAIFSVVDAVLFRPLPYPASEKLVLPVTRFADSGHGGESWGTSQNGATWEILRDQAQLLDWAVFAGSTRLNLVAERQVQYVNQQRVSAGFFRVLGIGPSVGREFTRDEDRPGGARVVVLSHTLWQRMYNGAWPIERPLLLKGEPYTIVGVMPPGFSSTEPADVWTPLRPSRFNEGAGENYTILGRLRPGVTLAAASASIAAIGRAVTTDLRTRGVDAQFMLIGLQRGLTSAVREPLLVLMAGVLIVLLIGCLNVAGLLVARGLDRTPEMAARMALGAGRSAVFRQLVVESLVLASLGGLAALVVARVAIAWLSGTAAGLGDEYLQSTYGLWQPVRIDGRVLAVTALLALATSLIFGLTPALQVLRLDIRRGLTGAGGRGVARAATLWPRRFLVVAQISLGVVLVANAALVVRSFAHLTTRTAGIDTTNVLAAKLPLQDVRYRTNASVNELFDRTLSAIQALPGVESAGVSLTLPFERGLNLPFRRTGSVQSNMMVLSYVTPGYFRTLRVPVRVGRAFDLRDTPASLRVVVVNETFAKRFFRDRDPLMETLQFGGARPGLIWSIVGVVGDVPQKASLSGYEPIDMLPAVYMPATQMPEGFSMVHVWFSPGWAVRTTTSQPGLVAGLERVMSSIDPQIPFASFGRIEDAKRATLAPERFQATLLGSFSVLAVLLAAIGLYGLVAKSVAERTQELGIRLALGSTATRAIATVAGPIVVLAAVGIGMGAALAGAGARLLRSQLWGVSDNDPLTLGATVFGIFALAAIVSLLASLRIVHLNPAETLRRE